MPSIVNWIVLPLAVLWTVSEFGLFAATYSRRQEQLFDRNSMRLAMSATTVATLAGFALWYSGLGNLSWAAAWLVPLGTLLMLGGLALRWTAIMTLRSQFTIHVAVTDEHRLITHGIYRFLRHPAYAGSLLCLLGIGVALENPFSLVLVVGGPLASLLYRIRVEEAVLSRNFGPAYTEYCARSARLIPGIF